MYSVNKTRCGDNYSNWDPLLEGYTSGKCPWTLTVFDMPLQIATAWVPVAICFLICCGSTHHDVDNMLSEDSQSLSGWNANSKMHMNIKNLV